MKLPITAAALIGLATAFGPAGTVSAASLPASLPDGTAVIEAGGRHFGGRGGGRHDGFRSGHRRGGGDFGHRGNRRSGHRGDDHRFGHRRGHRRHDFGHHGHGYGHGYGNPYYYFGGAALGTYLYLHALEDY